MVVVRIGMFVVLVCFLFFFFLLFLFFFLVSQLIIRSHEGPDARSKRPGLVGMEDGYTIDHVVESGKLITLFSAPDYPQFQVSSFPLHI